MQIKLEDKGREIVLITNPHIISGEVDKYYEVFKIMYTQHNKKTLLSSNMFIRIDNPNFSKLNSLLNVTYHLQGMTQDFLDRFFESEMKLAIQLIDDIKFSDKDRMTFRQMREALSGISGDDIVTAVDLYTDRRLTLCDIKGSTMYFLSTKGV